MRLLIIRNRVCHFPICGL